MICLSPSGTRLLIDQLSKDFDLQVKLWADALKGAVQVSILYYNCRFNSDISFKLINTFAQSQECGAQLEQMHSMSLSDTLGGDAVGGSSDDDGGDFISSDEESVCAPPYAAELMWSRFCEYTRPTRM